MSQAKKRLLVGWDSADWKIIQPLVDAGQMPAVKHLLERGTAWQSDHLRTAALPHAVDEHRHRKHACHHSVSGFTEVNDAGQVVPVCQRIASTSAAERSHRRAVCQCFCGTRSQPHAAGAGRPGRHGTAAQAA